ILARMHRRLPLLIGGAGDLPARQQTMRDAIGWGHELLDASEQILFRTLGVFMGGFTLEAAEAVAGGDADVAGGLESLVANSLVRREPAGGDSRFVMLETLREYALERLAASGEERVSRERHAEFFLEL